VNGGIRRVAAGSVVAQRGLVLRPLSILELEQREKVECRMRDRYRRRCRQSSIARKWLREFELHKSMALDCAEAVTRGGLSKAARNAHAQERQSLSRQCARSQTSDTVRMKRVILNTQADVTAARVSNSLTVGPTIADPLVHFRPQVRAAYEHIIGLIYDCASNRAAAKALVTKILAKLETGSAKATKAMVRRRSRG
jgi:molecular chaperone HtpG